MAGNRTFLAMVTMLTDPYLEIGGGPIIPPTQPPTQPPPVIWPGPNPPYPDIGGPAPKPPGPVYPSHPIWRPDLGIWGGPFDPPRPSHPIYNPGGPPGSSPPGFWGGGMGPGVKPQPPWPQPPGGGGGPPNWSPIHPEHPIANPFPPYVDIGGPGPQPPFPSRPPQPPGVPGQLPGSDPGGSGWVWAYVPGYGWMWAQVPQQPGSGGGTTPPPGGGGTQPPTDPNAPHPDHTLPGNLPQQPPTTTPPATGAAPAKK
jgi:hypothetical protein